MKPFFGRIGSKYRVRNEIIKRIPSHKTYIEPFIGGGAILFAKEPSEIEIINDLDDDLMKAYELLKNIKNFKNANIDPTNLIELNKYYKDKTKNTENDVFIKYILRFCNTFNNIGSEGVSLFKNSNYERKTKKLELYQDRLKNVKMFSDSYEVLIKNYDDAETFFFLDPPYEDSKKIYKKGNFDLIKLQEILKDIKGKFLLTLNDSQNVRELFKNYKLTSFKVEGTGHDKLGSGIRYELFITNF